MTPERGLLLAQILKLRAHAVSARTMVNPNPIEADSFDTKATKLMTEYNITEQELTDYASTKDVVEAPTVKLNCYRVLYSVIRIDKHPSGNKTQDVRHGQDRNKFVVATSDQEAGDAVLGLHPDFDEVQIQQVSTVAKDILVVE